MKTTIDSIKKEICVSREYKKSGGRFLKSAYYQINNSLIRIADHLPCIANVECYNEDVEKIFLIFIGEGVHEDKIEKFIEKNQDKFQMNYFIDLEELDDNFESLDYYFNMFING